MFNFSVKTLRNSFGSPRNIGSPVSGDSPARPESPQASISPKTDVGEIDTRAPFESVKAAVSLFGDVGSPRARPVTKKTKAEEQRLLEKETQHHMILRELDYYKDQLRSTENAKAQALKDLQRASRTLQELTNKLETLSESKQAAVKAAEIARSRAKELEEQKSLKAQLGTEAWKEDVDTERERYKASSGEVIASKQELTNLRQDFDAATETKVAAIQEEEDALQAVIANQEKRSQLSEEVRMLRQTLDRVKCDSHRAEEEHLKLVAEKEVHLLVHKSAKETADNECTRLKEEYGPEDNLTQKLEEVTEAVKVLQEQLHLVRASDLSSLQGIVSELNDANKELQEEIGEESSIRTSVDSLKLQLEEAKRGSLEWDKNASEAELKLDQMQAELGSRRVELEAARSKSVFEDMKSNVEKLLADADKRRQETEEVGKVVESLRQEAETARVSAQETEEKLEIALQEAEDAKAAEKLAGDQIHNSPKTDHVTTSVSGRKIRLSADEFELMNQKVEECKNRADEKVATLRAHIENINAREKEVLQKIVLMSKEMEDIDSEIEDAVKRSEMAEAAKGIIEGELQKWRRKEETDVGESSHVSEGLW